MIFVVFMLECICAYMQEHDALKHTIMNLPGKSFKVRRKNHFPIQPTLHSINEDPVGCLPYEETKNKALSSLS